MRRMLGDDPMVIRCYQITDPQGACRELKLSLHHRYWNKVTTFTKHLQSELSQLFQIANSKGGSQKPKTFVIPLKEDSFEYGYLHSYFH